jgi:hypothetical protein
MEDECLQQKKPGDAGLFNVYRLRSLTLILMSTRRAITPLYAMSRTAADIIFSNSAAGTGGEYR